VGRGLPRADLLADLAQLVHAIDQNPAVIADEKLQLIDRIDGAINTIVHAGNVGQSL
jgi:hypothetical protein